MSMHIDKLCLQLGVEDGLAAVEPAIAGEQVAEGAGGGEIDQTAGAEELNAEDDGGDGAVHRAAEHGHQADGGGKGGRQAQQSAEHAAEGTTSPPLKPQPMVTAVKASFNSQAQGSA